MQLFSACVRLVIKSRRCLNVSPMKHTSNVSQPLMSCGLRCLASTAPWRDWLSRCPDVQPFTRRYSSTSTSAVFFNSSQDLLLRLVHTNHHHNHCHFYCFTFSCRLTEHTNFSDILLLCGLLQKRAFWSSSYKTWQIQLNVRFFMLTVFLFHFFCCYFSFSHSLFLVLF